MLFKKLLDARFENSDFGGHLQAVRVQALPSGLTGNRNSNDRERMMARRARRRSRQTRREPFNSGGWSVRSW